MEKNTLIIIVIFVVLAVTGLILGLVLGLKKSDDEPKLQSTSNVEIVNSYTNTEQLIKDFPVINNTTVYDGIEKNIQNRLLTGFANWNRGFEAWKAWGNILYRNDSIYNVHGARLTLEHYQEDMYETLGKMSIDMGNFNNMLIVGNYCAIYYDIIIGKSRGTTMEFVQFTDHGSPGNPDVRVVEGWGGVKDDTYYSSLARQGTAEKQVQEEQNNFLLTYNPEGSYFIKYPTNNTDSRGFTGIILEGFDKWNLGEGKYLEWVNDYFHENVTSKYGYTNRNLDQYKAAINKLFAEQKVTKLYLDNLLVRDDWVAIHYRYRSLNKQNTKVTFGDRMEFFKFDNETLRIVGNWIK